MQNWIAFNVLSRVHIYIIPLKVDKVWEVIDREKNYSMVVGRRVIYFYILSL